LQFSVLVACGLALGAVQPLAGQTTVRIRDIQGSAHTSPRVNQTVSGVPGIVTALASNGFYLQDPSPDSNVSTSEGIFVFTGSTPTVAVGDSVTVGGTVTEFRFSNATNDLTVTQITNPTISLVSRNNPLPAAIVIGSGGRIPPTTVITDDSSGNVNSSPFDPGSDGIDFYESLEGMRVQVNSAVVVGPNVDSNEFVVLGDSGNNAGVRSPRGGIVIQAFDFNPERIFVSPTSTPPRLSVGARFTGAIVGVLTYNNSNFKIIPTASLPSVTASSLSGEVSALTPSTGRLTIASFNVENLNPNSASDPNGNRFTRIGQIVVNNLRSPDILCLQEVQDSSGTSNNGIVDATTTLNTLLSAISTAGGPAYQFRQINPVDGADGGAPGGNIRSVFLFNPARVGFVDRSGGGSTTANSVVNSSGQPQLQFSPGRIDPNNSAFNGSRKPLAAEFTFDGQKVFAVCNHFNSKGGDTPLFGDKQPPILNSEAQRTSQATIVRNFVASILSIDPNARVVVLGDLNDFEFANPVITLAGTVLNNLTELLPTGERYTFNFQGNSQTLDHILVSGALTSGTEVDIVHVNSEFAAQVSDHDPVLARLAVASAPAVSQLIGNPGFENGSANPAPWVATANVIDNTTSQPARSGAWKAWLNGYGTTFTDTLRQTVTIPANASSATLTFYLKVTTAETTTTVAYDTLRLQIRNSSGTVLATLATYSNLNASSGYVQRSFNLNSYRGQTVQIHFVGTEDSSLATSFFLDDFALNSQ
jgi:hypothetical protein